MEVSFQKRNVTCSDAEEAAKLARPFRGRAFHLIANL